MSKSTPTNFIQYGLVKIMSSTARPFTGTKNVTRHPQIGDIGIIVDVPYSGVYTVECVDQEGYTVWLADFVGEELSLIGISPTIQEQAALLHRAFLLGLVEKNQINAWAEKAIAEQKKPNGDFSELALAKSSGSITKGLTAIAGQPFPKVHEELILALLGKRFDASPAKGQELARLLYNAFCSSGWFKRYEMDIHHLDDNYCIGMLSREDCDKEFKEFLTPFQTIQSDFLQNLQ